MGKHFGFITFSGVCNNDHMVKYLREVWFGYQMLFASVPRFSKNYTTLSCSYVVPSKVERLIPR